jgi:hypothetical protein
MDNNNFNNALSGMINKAPEFLLFSMVLSFVLMFSVQLFYYATIFDNLVPNVAFSYAIGCGIGLMYQLARLSFGLGGAYEFSRGKSWTGIIGLMFSFGLTLFEAFEVEEMAMYWSQNDDTIYHSILLGLQAVIWLGLALEIRLALSIKQPKPTTQNPQTHPNGSPNGNQRGVKNAVQT